MSCTEPAASEAEQTSLSTQVDRQHKSLSPWHAVETKARATSRSTGTNAVVAEIQLGPQITGYEDLSRSPLSCTRR